jgi:hypothetical protein
MCLGIYLFIFFSQKPDVFSSPGFNLTCFFLIILGGGHFHYVGKEYNTLKKGNCAAITTWAGREKNRASIIIYFPLLKPIFLLIN